MTREWAKTPKRGGETGRPPIWTIAVTITRCVNARCCRHALRAGEQQIVHDAIAHPNGAELVDCFRRQLIRGTGRAEIGESGVVRHPAFGENLGVREGQRCAPLHFLPKLGWKVECGGSRSEGLLLGCRGANGCAAQEQGREAEEHLAGFHD